MNAQTHIRNFAIVAHIDHGKSTLADRLLEMTHTVEERLMREQILDSNPIERERGITIKLAPVRMNYRYKGQNYILNLIDTPGHVDFSYEVSRSLAACEGILLVVDASQGIQAQTIAHMQLVKMRNLKVIPILNKIDLPTAKIEETKKALSDMFGFSNSEILEVSAKTGKNIDKVLSSVIEKIPPPSGEPSKSLRALIFSSQYDVHRGVVVYVRIVDGNLELTSLKNSGGFRRQLKFLASGIVSAPLDIGIFTPSMKPAPQLLCGEVGFIATGLKDVRLARVGDTITWEDQLPPPLPGYQEPKPMVFLSIYPTDSSQYLELRESFAKLHLSDSSFSYSPHSSPALGKGFLCGFLGLLHADVIKERLEREFAVNIIATAPTVEYTLVLTSGKTLVVHTPEDFPDRSLIKTIKEPLMYMTIFTPAQTVGSIIQLCQEKRGQMVNLDYIGDQAKFTYTIPLAEMIVDFFDRLKSVTSGYASLDYELYELGEVDAVKLDVYINREPVDAFSQIVVAEKAQYTAEKLVEKLKHLIPRHQFQIPIQAVIGGKIISRSDVKAFRKDVTQKLYGGDRTRKDKLLEAQRKGKKRMREFGNVSIPQEVFLDIYK
ncbi:elongation factor 4 [Candidatus Gottesmanbacteria bacterium]|nr:elongation factor 4 [Candidatus Gottesmanbacteria bacterium]